MLSRSLKLLSHAVRVAIYYILLTLLVVSTAFSQEIQGTHKVTVMTFNVENLFDNVHDEGKDDETYLPLLQKTTQHHIEKCNKIDVSYWREQCLYWDWNDAVVNQKLNSISLALKQVNNGHGPDIIAFQEVENERILERLRSEHLAGLGYLPAVLLEGEDARGIDVAFLAKYPALHAEHHEIEFPESVRERVGDTRPILQVDFELAGGERLTGFSVHFPAPFHPTVMRESAYTTLNNLLDQLPEGQIAFAAGDFNTTSEEDRKKDMLDRWVRPVWRAAHDICEGCPGSSYYGPTDEWSFLDMVLWHQQGDWEMTSSYLANETPEQITAEGTPKRFRLPEATGLSDHWPLVMVIEKNP